MKLIVRSGVSLIGLLVFSGACDSPEDSGAAGLDTKRGKYAVVKDWGCRDCDFTNSPYLGTFAFDRVGYGDTPGAEATSTLVSAVDPSGDEWPVYVDEFGLGVDQAGTERRGYDLIGWSLTVKLSPSVIQDVDIYAYEEVPGWDDNEELVPTFGLSYATNGEDDVNVCPGFDLDMTSVVFLDREIYDTASFGVMDGQDGVATLACRGHALAKMKLLQYDTHTGTTPEERLATLRMITADYCGDGTAQTSLGTLLEWTDQAGHVMFDPSTMSSIIEAEWDENGAICLNTPRNGVTVNCQPALPACEPEFSAHGGDAVWVSLLP